MCNRFSTFQPIHPWPHMIENSHETSNTPAIVIAEGANCVSSIVAVVTEAVMQQCTLLAQGHTTEIHENPFVVAHAHPAGCRTQIPLHQVWRQTFLVLQRRFHGGLQATDLDHRKGGAAASGHFCRANRKPSSPVISVANHRMPKFPPFSVLVALSCKASFRGASDLLV